MHFATAFQSLLQDNFGTATAGHFHAHNRYTLDGMQSKNLRQFVNISFQILMLSPKCWCKFQLIVSLVV